MEREDSKVFQGFIKEVLWVFQGRLRLNGVPRSLKKRFKGGSKVSKGVLKEFQGRIKDILRKFHGCVKKVLSVLQEKFQKISRVFQKVSMKFSFSILLLHGSHRSYPSRRRVSFFYIKITLF